MKKIIPLIVLWVFLLGSGGYFFTFKIEQYINYCSIVKESTNRDNKIGQHVFVFTIGNEIGVKWIKKQKEFIYHGQMYDVVNIITIKKQVHYYCINDTKEKMLITAFEKRNHSTGRSAQLIRKITLSHFILTSLSSNTFKQLFVCCYKQPACHYLPPVQNTLLPPPKQIRIT